MRYAAIIIDDRIEVANKAIAEHKKFLPNDWEVLNIKPPYEGGIYSLRSPLSYNSVLTNPSFWRGCIFDRVLIFQHDSGLLKSGIEEFLEWDYIGAPWKFQEHGGNGGLSIRNPRVMFNICQKFKYNHECNEDVWFCNKMKELNMNIAPREVCSMFSVESIYKTGTLGYHAMDKYLSKIQVETILNQYK
jgi:hypothetical protein